MPRAIATIELGVALMLDIGSRGRQLSESSLHRVFLRYDAEKDADNRVQLCRNCLQLTSCGSNCFSRK